jgi:hypothetical protein
MNATRIMVGLCVAAWPMTGYAAIVFDAPESPIVGDHPYAICSADFDGDGIPDLAVANVLSDDVSILMGQGGGSFRNIMNYPVNDEPRSICTGDFDKDGDYDIAVGNWLSHNISILLNDGGGLFGYGETLISGEKPWAVKTSDLNEDGNLDLVTACEGSDYVVVTLGNGDGTFQFPSAYTVGDGPRDVCVADFNGDGFEDFAAGSFISDDIIVFFGLGDGTFVYSDQYLFSKSPHSLCTADFDGDGDHDLAIVFFNAETNNLAVMFNNGDGMFAEPSFYTLGDESILWSLISHDFDDDGDSDLAVCKSYNNGAGEDVFIMLNAGNGTFEMAPPLLISDSGAYNCCTGDFDGNGIDDLAVVDCGYLLHTIHILLGNGDGTFNKLVQNAMSCPAGDGPFAICTADLDGDWDSDLAVGNIYSETVVILLNQGNGTFSFNGAYPIEGEPRAVCAFDINGDGDNDLAVADYTYDKILIFAGNGDGTFDPIPDVYSAGLAPRSLFSADVDNDGDRDLLAANLESSDVSVLLSYAHGRLDDAVSYAVGEAPCAVFAADLNSDGDVDIATANDASCDVSILLGNGDGTFQAAVSYAAGTNPRSLYVADINGDSYRDIVVANRNSNDISILLGNGDGSYQAATHIPVGYGPYSVLAADFDGDMDNDITTANQLSGDVAILENDGSGHFGIPIHYVSGVNPISLCSADFDGDVDIDIAAANLGSDFVTIYMNLTGGPVATLLESFSAMRIEHGIEISWSLSALGLDPDFRVLRCEGGADEFVLLTSEITRVGMLSYLFIDESCKPGVDYLYKVEVTDSEGTKLLFVTDLVTAPVPPFTLAQNVPNPFNPVTTISYSLSSRSHVTLTIYDVQGHRIAKLVDGEKDPGIYHAEWLGRDEDGRTVQSGVYFYRLQAGKEQRTRKMVLLK